MRRIDLYLRFIWWFFFCSWVDFFVSNLPCSKSRKNRIAIIRIDSIGDFVLSLTAAQDIRRAFPAPEFHITLYSQTRLTEFAKGFKEFDEVIPVDKKLMAFSPLQRFRQLRAIRSAGYHCVFYLNYTRDFVFGDSLIRASSATHRLGMVCNLELMTRLQRWISNRWYTRLIDTGTTDQMELRRTAAMLRAVGISNARATIPELTPKTPASDLPAGRFYILSPGAAYTFRSWPISKFAEFARRFYRETGWTGVICGGPGEVELVQRLIEITGNEAPLIDRCGKMDLWGFTALVQAAALVVTNDTGTVHIAAAAGTAAIAILGNAQPNRFLPYDVEFGPGRAPTTVSTPGQCNGAGCEWFCHYRTGVPDEVFPCVRDVAVDDVLAKAVALAREIAA